MRVLPLWQPWASLIAVGTKKIETRHWLAPQTIIGERIAIYATKSNFDREVCDDDPFNRYIVNPDRLPLGLIICTVEVKSTMWVDDAFADELEQDDPHEYAFGRYRPTFDDPRTRAAWVLRNPETLDEPVEWKAKNKQGIGSIDPAELGLRPPQETLL